MNTIAPVPRQTRAGVLAGLFGSLAVAVALPMPAHAAALDARHDQVTAVKGGRTKIDVLRNDTLPASGYSVRIKKRPQHGRARFNADNKLVYDARPGFTGIDRVVYVLADAQGRRDTATVTIRVKPGNKSSLRRSRVNARPDRASVTQGERVHVNVLRNDDHPAKGYRLTIKTPPRYGQAYFNKNNELVYKAPRNKAGADRVVYVLTDAEGRSDKAIVEIWVSRAMKGGGARKAKPIARPDRARVAQGRKVYINVLRNDDHPPKGYRLRIRKPPQYGHAYFNSNQKLVYVAPTNYAGMDRVVYVLEDATKRRDTAVVQIAVQGPGSGGSTERAVLKARPDTGSVEAGQRLILDVLANDQGLQHAPFELAIVDPPTKGSAVVQADNTVAYVAPAGFDGQDQFTYRVRDALGNQAMATGTVQVTCKSCAQGPKLILSWDPPPATVDAYRIYFDNTPQADALLLEVSVIDGDVDAARPRVQFDVLGDLRAKRGDTVCFRVRAVAGDES